MSQPPAQSLLLTPGTPGAIAVILLAGPAAATILTELTPSPLPSAGRTKLVPLTHAGAPLDHALLLCLAPDRYELHLHGGPAVIAQTQSALAALGASALPPDSPAAAALAFPPAVFSDPRFAVSPLIHSELLATLPQAQTMTAVDLLASQSTRGLTAWAQRQRAALGAQPIWRLASATQFLLDRSADLAHLLTPPRVALIGPPNAGKSTLANALHGRTVSITSDIPGTTRDWVDAITIFSAPALGETHVDVPVRLIDTAGVRPDPDGGAAGLEAQSIARTHAQAVAAHVLIAVVDAAAHIDLSFLDPIITAPGAPPIILALNKSDLLPPPAASRFPNAHAGFPTVSISALTATNLDFLQRAVLRQLGLADLSVSEPFAFTARQRHLLRELALAPKPATAQRFLHALLGDI